jgi:hypothetical protein
MVRGVNTKTLGGKRIPEDALVRTGVAVGVRLDDGVTGSEESWVAGLESNWEDV